YQHVVSLSMHIPSAEELALARERTFRFLRVACTQALIARKRGTLKRFINGDLNLAWDWFRNANRIGRDDVGVPANVARNASWASIMRHQQAWHDNRAERERLQREANERAYEEYRARQDRLSWQSALPQLTVDGITAQALTNGAQLRAEGTQMRHCV